MLPKSFLRGIKLMLGSWQFPFPMPEAYTGFLSVRGLPGFWISGTLEPLAPLGPLSLFGHHQGWDLCIPEQRSQSEGVATWEWEAIPLAVAPHHLREVEGASRSKPLSHHITTGEDSKASLQGGLVVRNKMASLKYGLPVYGLKWMPWKLFIWPWKAVAHYKLPKFRFPTWLFTPSRALKVGQTRMECVHFNRSEITKCFCHLTDSARPKDATGINIFQIPLHFNNNREWSEPRHDYSF